MKYNIIVNSKLLILMKHFLIVILSILFFSCNSLKDKDIKSNDSGKISVLNFGSAHLTHTSDANTAVRDLKDLQVKKDINKIVKSLVAYKPTVICIEMQPDNNSFVNEVFQKYIIDQSNRLNYSEELNAIAFETARLSDVKYIYGIDDQMGFDYPSLIDLANRNTSDSLFVMNQMNSYKEVNNLPLLEQFHKINTKEYKMETFNFYNFLATMHTNEKYEGADIIADFYKRNIRMYSNFCDIPLTKNDRVLIILGATHTAYFDVFLENNPKYKVENTLDHLSKN
tara:strand:- start:60405 stop:61253 length:849 start_codon:yes stop_codon:yes gene_type:complete